MNKNLKKLMMALMLIGAVCGTANAATKGGHDFKGKAPIAMKATSKGRVEHKGFVEHKGHARGKGHVAKVHHDHKAHFVGHHDRHHDMHHHDVHKHDVVVVHERNDGWAVLGATVVGGVIGAIVGAAL